MPIAEVNGTSLLYDFQGAGPPLVLVHGAFSEGASWQPVVPGLAETFKVVTYDRRGHGQSGPPSRLPTLQEHVDDLAALIRGLDLAPAHVVGVSGGASVACWFAIRYPELCARVAGHEPGFMLALPLGPATLEIVDGIKETFEQVVERLDAGDYAAGVEAFVDGIVAPGAWALMPEPIQTMFVRNAPAFHAELRAFDAMYVDLEALAKTPVPLLLTDGAATEPHFAAIVERLTSACPNLDRHTFTTAHVPMWTEPDQYVSVVTRWLTGRTLTEEGLMT